MAMWLYQLTQAEWPVNSYRLDIWEGERWRWEVNKVSGAQGTPVPGDTICFYYAKSGRHALPAIVPHHGTLLRVGHDGARTEILASGFRAANGVCLNPDGSFVVTDQEGFWTPKNRINLVEKGGFYGNLWGYTDVTDTSDAAMKQPLCWVTNDFDRSPAELLWVTSRQEACEHVDRAEPGVARCDAVLALSLQKTQESGDALGREVGDLEPLDGTTAVA